MKKIYLLVTFLALALAFVGFQAEAGLRVGGELKGGVDADNTWTGTQTFQHLGLDQNVETLSGIKTLATSDLPVQKLDPDGSDRDVTLPAEASSTDIVFFIYNMANGAGEDLAIKNDAPATLATILPGNLAICHCDGTTWTIRVALPPDDLQVDGVAGSVAIDGSTAAVVEQIGPRRPANAVALTASGTDGINASDNDNLDMGTSDFSVVIRGSLPDWEPGSMVYLVTKTQGAGDYFQIYLDGTYIRTAIKVGNVNELSLAILGTISSLGLEPNVTYELAFVYDRRTSSEAGSVKTYVDGILKNTLAVAAGTTLDCTNTGSWTLRGVNSTSSGAAAWQNCVLFNRAISAAEAKSLYQNGIDFADQWGSQAELMTTQADRDFSGASDWTNTDIDTYDETDDLSLTASATGQTCYITFTNLGTNLTEGKRYRLEYDYSEGTAGFEFKLVGTATQTLGDAVDGTDQTIEFTAEEDYSGAEKFGIYSKTNAAASGDFDNFSIVRIGSTFALEPEGIQPAPGQWLDSSSNKNHAMQPAAGSSLKRMKKDFEYRWANAWTASSTAQYIGGQNKNVLSDEHYITDIISNVLVDTDVENIEIGDGNDPDEFVTDVAPSGTTAHTIAKATNDGTNKKLVVTPAASATMTIEFIVRGFLMEP